MKEHDEKMAELEIKELKEKAGITKNVNGRRAETLLPDFYTVTITINSPGFILTSISNRTHITVKTLKIESKQ